MQEDPFPQFQVRLEQKLVTAERRSARFLRRTAPFWGMGFAVLLFLGAWGYFGVYQPSAFFPVRTVVNIPQGATLVEIATMLEDAQVVRYGIAFTAFVLAEGGANRIQAGDYYFDNKLTLSEVADRLVSGNFGLTPVTVTIPEGATTYQMAEIFRTKLDRFDPVTFLALASEKEGYLFPDTYQFLPNATADTVIELMERTFYERISELEADVASFGRPLHEIITMASLLEKEAYRLDHKRMIAGVLWKRLEIGMPLQVDAVFGFIKGTHTFSPRYSDLAVESPYNTYKYDGLPPGPISSPGLDSLKAAVQPIATDALFYLHGRDGKLYASRTYQEHLSKKRTYLD